MVSPVTIWRDQKEIVGLTGQTGKVVAYTVIRLPQEEFVSQAPYPLAIVKLESGTRIMLQLVDTDGVSLHIGDKVVLTVRKMKDPDVDGVIPYGIKGKLVW